MAELAEHLLNEENLGRSRVRAVLKVHTRSAFPSFCKPLFLHYIFIFISKQISALY